MTQRSIKIYFFGDSICEGQRFPTHRGWVNQISQRLEADYPHKNIVVSKFAINGRTTRQALETMPYHIQSNAPDILLIQFGMNDCNYWKSDQGVPRVSAGSFRANLSEMINRARCFGVDKIIINTNHPTGLNSDLPFTQLTYQQSNEQYNQLIRQVAIESNVILLDMEKEFLTNMARTGNVTEDYVLPDLLHLGEKGHQLYIQAAYPVIERYIP